jgi:predicted AlkP superfamily phosphohydrolase/phosphomutase
MRTLAIGLDGCSWNVLEPLLDTGELPNLAALRDRGAHGVLESTIPFFTGPAWCSFATAASPAAHGIYDFMMLREDGGLRVAHQSDLRRRTYYQQLGQQGRRSVLINLPLDQNGCEGAVIVNSWLTDDDSRRILPLGRQERYAGLLEAYRTFPVNPADIDELCEIEHARFELARELFLAESWDHFFVLFSSTDWLGHSATGLFLEGDEGARKSFLQLYREIDRYVGWFVDHADDATAAVLSDHGQCEVDAIVYVNALLRELGLVTLASPRDRRPSPFFVDRRPRPRARWHVPHAFVRYAGSPLVRPAAMLVKRALRRTVGVELARTTHPIDRVASRAFSPTDASFAVHTRDCDAEDIAQIRKALCDLRLKDGRPAIDGVWTPSELYGREGDPGAPSLLFAPAKGVRPSAGISEGVIGTPRTRGRGTHQRDGIVLLAGPPVLQTELARSSIMDVAPTLLWAMGEGVPAGADGRPLFEAFAPEFVEAQPVAEADSEPLETADEGEGAHSEEVARRLKALGYI